MKELLSEMYEWVGAYIKTFYSDDADVQEKVLLKEEHTRRVAAICRALAGHLQLSERDQVLAEIIGLYHDIGRFKQYTVYRTFNDFISENHAALGLREIADEPLLKRLSAEDLSVFRFAIGQHNAVEIASTANARQMLFAKVIRDADKLDIYRVLKPTILPSDGSGYSEAFSRGFLRGEQCDYAKIQTQDERKLVRLLWIYNVYFSWTLKEIMARGYVDHIVRHLPDTDVTRSGVMLLRQYIALKVTEDDRAAIAGKDDEKAK